MPAECISFTNNPLAVKFSGNSAADDVEEALQTGEDYFRCNGLSHQICTYFDVNV